MPPPCNGHDALRRRPPAAPLAARCRRDRSAAQAAGLAFAAAGRPSIPHPGERAAGGAAKPHRGGRRGRGGRADAGCGGEPPFPNNAPAENSIEGEPLRMKNTGRQDAAPPHRECSVRSRHPRAGGFIYVIDGGRSPVSAVAFGSYAE
jgi:hypothetical protein